MKLDITAEQRAWLRDTLRRVEEGQNLDDEEQAALDSYYNAEYYEWLQDRELDERPLTVDQERYLSTFLGYDDHPDGVAVYHEPAASRPAARKPRSKRRGCLGELLHRLGVGLVRLVVTFVVLGLVVYYIPRLVGGSGKPSQPATPAPVKSAAEVVAEKAEQLRASKKAAPAAKPAAREYSAWRTITYTGGDGRERPALVGDDTTSGAHLVIRDPRGSCLIEIQADKSFPIGGPHDWIGSILVGDRELCSEQWFRRTDRIGTMKLVDASGTFEPAHGRVVLDRILAEDESGQILLGYPRPNGRTMPLAIPLSGLHAAFSSIPEL